MYKKPTLIRRKKIKNLINIKNGRITMDSKAFIKNLRLFIIFKPTFLQEANRNISLNEMQLS